MSRRARPEQQFGSDSFLDVICNVVGILIILMVLAGVKASQAPVILPTMSVPTAQEQLADDEGPPVDGFLAEEAVDEEMSAEPIEMPLAEPEPVEPPPELVARAAELEEELGKAGSAEQRLAQKVAELKALLARLQEERETLTQQEADQQTKIQLMQKQATGTTVQINHLRRVVDQLNQAVQEQGAKAPRTKTLEHRITPIGKVVTGKELHFRILNDRVSVVPLDRLVTRLQGQIERHKDWIAKSRQQLGQVGPIDGYTMHYVVEREAGSVADELRMGPGVFRISVTEWKLESERDVITESVDEALKPRSRFSAALIAAESGSSITCWVYPDSFGAYAQLKAHCEKQNFLVAGRPLPTGIPIAGSPSGTKSTAQ